MYYKGDLDENIVNLVERANILVRELKSIGVGVNYRGGSIVLNPPYHESESVESVLKSTWLSDNIKNQAKRAKELYDELNSVFLELKYKYGIEPKDGISTIYFSID